jgi:subtilisin family serine protease
MRAILAVALLTALVLSGCLGGEKRTQWAFTSTQITDMAALGRTGQGVTVAILDTGINLNHPSLSHLHDGNVANGEVVAYHDYIDGSDGVAAAQDHDGHGSHVAGIIAAHGSSTSDKLAYGGVDLLGGAPNVRLVIARVCGGDTCKTDAIPTAVTWAVNQGADVISLSLGGERADNLFGLQSDQLTNAINAAIDSGVVVVASAGNEGTKQGDVAAPADIPGVIAVGAVDSDLSVWSDSNRGADMPCQTVPVVGTQNGRCPPNEKPELVAPGVDILSAWAGSSYVRATGTSQACPFVTSVVALILEGRPDLPNRAAVMDLKQSLIETARPIEGQHQPHDLAAGYGLVQAKAAYNDYAR